MDEAVDGAAIYLVVVLGALVALRAGTGGRESPSPRPTPSAVALWLVVAVPSVLQMAVLPGLLDALMRDADRILDGQLWRLFTSAVVQDGGLVGMVSNLVLLGICVNVATAVWGARRTWLTFGSAVPLADLAVLGWEPTGAGSSMATLALAGALVSDALVGPGTRWRTVLPALGVLGSVVALAVLRDYHAAACAIGALLGGLPATVRRARPRTTTSTSG